MELMEVKISTYNLYHECYFKDPNTLISKLNEYIKTYIHSQIVF